jgi:multimeric flavodoxin WrbA
MPNSVLVLSGSPKKDGNTAALINWCAEGAVSRGAAVETIHIASLKFRAVGCTSCRVCQKMKGFGCVIEDDVQPVLKKMLQADVIVMATPCYFYAMSAQLKSVLDRMFSLYKWDNAANTMETPLKGKTLAVIASAYEEEGLDIVAKPFAVTAAYSGMRFESLLVHGAGTSGDIVKKPGAREEAIAFGKKLSS